MAFFDGGAVRIRYRFSARRPRVAIRIAKARSGRVVRRFVLRRRPGRTHVQRWRGLTGRGRPAEDGRYRILIGPPGGPFRSAGGVRLLGHFFPVRAPHGTRALGWFGAPREGGRTHEGFDVVAACGSRLAAARGGRVLRAGYDPDLYGNFVLIGGRAERRNYFYAHLRSPSPARRGERVRTGQRIGAVGRTGNARTTGCHLHFELRRDGVPHDPGPALDRWDAYS